MLWAEARAAKPASVNAEAIAVRNRGECSFDQTSIVQIED